MHLKFKNIKIYKYEIYIRHIKIKNKIKNMHDKIEIYMKYTCI